MLLVGALIGKTTGKKNQESPKIEPGHVLYDLAVPLVKHTLRRSAQVCCVLAIVLFVTGTPPNAYGEKKS